jgi:hypothetical protein
MAAPALIRPASSFAEMDTKSKSEKQSEREISAVEDLMREHWVLTRILLIYDEIS